VEQQAEPLRFLRLIAARRIQRSMKAEQQRLSLRQLLSRTYRAQARSVVLLFASPA